MTLETQVLYWASIWKLRCPRFNCEVFFFFYNFFASAKSSKLYFSAPSFRFAAFAVILSDLFLHRCLSLCYFISWNYHGTIIRTGITCKKILCYRCNSACRWFIVKKLKYFEVMLNIFEFSLVWRNVVSWLVYANKLVWIVQPYSSTDITKRS